MLSKKMKRNNGITLVALVVTIIILLILAAISIQALTNTDLFAKANEAKEKTQNAAENQAKTLNEYEDELNKYILDSRSEIDEIKIVPENATLQIGETLDLVVTILPENAVRDDIIWNSSNPKIATIDENGKVTALEKGTTMITAMVQGKSNVQGKCTLIVEDNILYLYKEGNEYNKITGGWQTWYYNRQVNYIRGSDYLRYYHERASVAGGWATAKKIDVSEYTKLKASFVYNGRCVANLSNSNNGVNAYVNTKYIVSTYASDTTDHWKQDESGNYYADISDINGEWYITFGANDDILATDVTIKKIWLEK